MEGDLNVLLRVPRPDVIGRVMVLGTDGEDGKEHRQPRGRDGLCRLGRCSGVLCSVLKIDHEARLEVVDVDDEAPERLRNFLVCSEQSGAR